MRILLLTQWFDPEPTFKGLAFAKELQRLGHSVEVLTGYPNYPQGRLYEGYRMRPFESTEIDGIRVNRVALYPSHSTSKIARIANYVSFAASSSARILTIRRPDVVYVYHPPATVALPAMLARWVRGVPFVVDVQDLWPDTLAATGMVSNERVLQVVGTFMDVVYRTSSHVTGLSDGFKRRLTGRGLPEHKVSTIPNWTHESSTVGTASPRGGEGLRVLYAGNFGPAQQLEVVIAAAQLLESEGTGVRFTFLGEGISAPDLKQEVSRRRLESVEFLDRVTPDRAAEMMAEADLLLVHLKRDSLFEITIPSKIQSYLRAGRPLLMGVAGEGAKIVEESGAGICFEPGSPDSLAEAVRRMAAVGHEGRSRMGERGRSCYEEQLSLSAGTRKFVEVFERVSRAHRPYDRAKRALDVVGSLGGLTVGALPMALTALAVRQKLGSPILFTQERPGRNGRPFNLYKFRTMTSEVDEHGELLPDSERLKPFGAFLRRTSLDELPELINILKGDMSLVGPRPLLYRYLPFFTEEESVRMEVRPGLTGWAQVNGRNTATWDDRLAHDAWYVHNRSLGVDLKILTMTVMKALGGAGVVVVPDSVMQDLDDERRHRAFR